MNNATISGNLGRDPDIRNAGGGNVAGFTVAVNNSYKDRSGEWVEKTAWVRCSAFGRLADKVSELRKGDGVVVTGKLESRQWQDKDGNKRESLEINAYSVEAIRKVGLNGPRATEDSFGQGGLDDEIPF